MGMYDHVVVLDEVLRCPHGHQVDGFQTKSFDDPSMETYLLNGSHVHHVTRAELAGGSGSGTAHWQLDGHATVYRRRRAVSAIVPRGDVVFYTTCDECAPVLVRSDHPCAWGDLVDERRLWVG